MPKEAEGKTPQASREVWTPKEAAAYLRLNCRTVTYMAKRREIPGRQIGSQWRFYRDELENLPIR